MKQSFATIVIALGSGLLIATISSAQESPPREWSITPQVGFYLGGTRIADGGPAGSVASEETVGQPVSVEMARSPLIGVGVHRMLTSHLRLRATAQGTLLSGPQARLHAGTEPCGSNCTRFLSEPVGIGTGGILAGAVDLALSAPAEWSVRPYVFYGLGGRHAWYDASDLPETFAPRNRSFAVGHSGVGLTIGLAGMEVDLEVASYTADRLSFGPFIFRGGDVETFLTLGLRP